MPYRALGTPAEVNAAWQGMDHVIIDATARAERRSPEDAKQREHYSGKKRPRLTRRSLPDKFIVFLGRTLNGMLEMAMLSGHISHASRRDHHDSQPSSLATWGAVRRGFYL